MEEYKFSGIHFLASYIGCNKNAINSPEQIFKAINKAIIASGATILGHKDHVFLPGTGYTVSFVLSESHCALHSYPEKRSCFVDLFTCGDKCSFKAFNKKLKKYLKPKFVNMQVIKRDSENETLSKKCVKQCKS